MAIKDPKPSTPAASGGAGRDVKASRRMIGMNVTLSLVAAACLLVVINIISNKHHWRRDMQTFGRYGLSDTARQILKQINQPVRLTSIYTSAEPDMKPADFLPEVRAVLEEIRTRRKSVTVIDVTNDSQKREVVERLRDQLDKAASEHRTAIDDFRSLVGDLSKRWRAMADTWNAYPKSGWLTQFGMAKGIETAVAETNKELQKIQRHLGQEVAGSGLPDYGSMVEKIRDMLTDSKVTLASIRDGLRRLASLPEASAQAKKDVDASMATMTGEIAKAVEALGQGAQPPADPAAVLKPFVTHTRAAGAGGDAAVRRLVQLDAESGGILRQTASWQVAAATTQRLARGVTEIADQAQQILAAAKVEVQGGAVVQLRPAMKTFTDEDKNARTAVDELLRRLTDVDKDTQAILDAAKADGYLKDQLGPIDGMLARTADLPDLKGKNELIRQIKEDNIVLVEVGDKSGVVSFDEAWPLKTRPEMAPPPPDKKPERAFNGDMAICSKMLTLSIPPLADVVLTYFEVGAPPSPYMRQQAPQVAGPIATHWLKTLRERLEKANLKVVNWNLAESDDPPAATPEPAAEGDPTPARPRVLLILPPPAPMPMMRGPQKQWGPPQVEKIKSVIASGTPAIFLTGYLRPRSLFQRFSPPYGLAEYLRQEWDLDVRTAMRLIPAERDPEVGDKYKLPVLRWTFLPLSSFTDHPIGRPLQARRMHWYEVCPILAAAEPAAGAEIAPILVVPSHRRDMWFSNRAQALEEQVYQAEGVYVAPGPDALLPWQRPADDPVPVAVKATRAFDDRDVSVVVLGVGMSYIDPFLNTRVPRLEGREILGSDPPSIGDVDLVINSVYHLTGRDEFIGAGPTVIQPIKIGQGALSAVKIIFGIAWPAALLALGVVVMVFRRR